MYIVYHKNKYKPKPNKKKKKKQSKVNINKSTFNTINNIIFNYLQLFVYI